MRHTLFIKSDVKEWGLFILVCALILFLYAGAPHPSAYNLFHMETFRFILTWAVSFAIFFLFPAGTSFLKGSMILIGLSVLAYSCIFYSGNVPGATGLSLFFRAPGYAIGGHLSILIFLLLYLKERRLDFRWAVFYALNPVVIACSHASFFLWHLPILCLVAGIYCHEKKYGAAMYLFLGISAGIHLPISLLLPFFTKRDTTRHMCLFPVFFIATALLMKITHGSTTHIPSFAMPGTASLTGPAFHIITLFVHDNVFAIMTASLLLLFTASYVFKTVSDPATVVFILLTAILLLRPEIYFGDILFLMPFAVLRQKTSIILLSFLWGVCFYGSATFKETFDVILWGPFLMLLFMDIYYFFKRRTVPSDHQLPISVSVVIPVKNEASCIKACIESIQNDPAVKEIIVVDGGSVDSTCEVARKTGATVVENRLPLEKGGGRGGQILTGIKQARSDVVAICHADTMVSSPIFSKMLSVLAKNPDTSGGVAGCVFDTSGFRIKWIEMGNVFRTVFTGISFGDQIQFFMAAPVQEARLFPDIPLMEDVEFGIRLHRTGRQIYLFETVLVSSRRWQNNKRKSAFWVIKSVTIYVITRLFKTPDTNRLYRDYYTTPKP